MIYYLRFIIVCTLQANGNGKGILLTRNGEDEEIVGAYVKA